MDESGTEHKPRDRVSPQLIAKDMNNELDTKKFGISGCDCSKRMCDNPSRPKRHGAAACRKTL